MKEPYGEGLASRTGPESCAVNREAGREALTGAHAGGVLSREMLGTQGADAVGVARKATLEKAILRAFSGPCEVEDPRHAWNLHAREPGDPTSARKQ